jgi:hypothetical protein
MKLTREQLLKIVQEEFLGTLKEGDPPWARKRREQEKQKDKRIPLYIPRYKESPDKEDEEEETRRGTTYISGGNVPRNNIPEGKMFKFTRSQLKKIITEEIQRMEEIKNDAVKLATMQDQMNKINGGGDDQLIIDISAMCDEMIDPISRISDGSMQGAMLQSLEVLRDIVSQISQDLKTRSRQAVQMPGQQTGGVQPAQAPPTQEENS